MEHQASGLLQNLGGEFVLVDNKDYSIQLAIAIFYSIFIDKW